MPCRLTALAVLLASLAWSTADVHALVISEVMYHSDEFDDQPFEYIEFYNENPDPFDLSGYLMCNGVSMEFPANTWIHGKSFLVICNNLTSFQAKYGTEIEAIAWDLGTLDNGGERVEICNAAGRIVLSLRYNDRDSWPSAADGTGHSLELRSPFLPQDDPDSWRISEDLGGTPGEPNGPSFDTGGFEPPTNGLDGAGFVLTWLTLGPYTGSACNLGNAVLEADWLRESAGGIVQSDLVWRDGDVVNTNYSLAQSTGLHANGPGVPTVEGFVGFSDTINLNDAIYPPDPNQVMAYAFVYVDNVTDNPLNVDLAVHSDDAIAVMVNGVHRLTSDACRGVGGSGEIADRAPATLDVGKNLVAVKCFENGGGWSFRLRFEAAGTQQAITSQSQIQITTDVDAGLNFGGGGTPILPIDGGGPPPPPPGQEPGDAPIVINEGFFHTGGTRWIEFYNRTNMLFDLTGYHVTDDPSDLTRSTLPGGSTIAAGGFLSFTEAELGLDFSIPVAGTRVFVALVEPAGDRVMDAFNFQPDHAGFSEARIPDGDDEFEDAADPTLEAANSITVNTDIVINEIMYHPIDDDLGKEYVELRNISGANVDLGGWAFTNGINYAFAAGTVVPANGYLVVARDPAKIQSVYGLSSNAVVGPDQTPEALAAFGRLANGGERLTLSDPLGRSVDSVRYREGGDWSRWADGGGSSLELIDPTQVNSTGHAWDASDDSAKAQTTTFSYIGQHGGGESELHVLLLDNGISVVDDISIIGGGVTTVDTPFIEVGETWRYFKGTTAPPASWNTLGFNDGSWLQGATGIGYGDGDDTTELTDMQNGYLTIFCRKTFNVTDPNAIDEFVLSIAVDDGFYAYINGTEVASYNVNGTGHQDPAGPAVGNSDLIVRDISGFKNLLQVGTNVLAVQVHNTNLGSSDLSFIPRLLDRTTTVSGGSEQVQNGTFNSNANGWIIQGTHVRSGRTTQNPINGAGSLKILASGRGDNKANRLETPNGGFGLNTLNVNEDLAISLDARWVVGAETLLTHGYEHAMAKAHSLAIPENLGTPGAINSVTQRWISDTGSSNMGPVVRGVSQTPPVPGDGEDVVVTARVADSDGVNSVTLRYSLNDPVASPSSIAMTHEGGGFYTGTIPGQSNGTKVVFYIEARDSGNRLHRYPADVTTRSHPLLLNTSSATLDDQNYLLYRHDVPDPGTNYHSYRFVMTDSNESFLSNRARLSNDLVPGAFMFDASQIYYGAFTRFSGSPFARGSWGGSFRVAFSRDNLMFGKFSRFNLDNRHSSGNDMRERISHYLLRQHNDASTAVPYSEPFTLARWQVNGRNIGNREHVVNPNGEFNSFWFPADNGGDFLEMDDRFVIGDDGGSRIGNTDGRVRYPPSSSRSDGDGENKENYRWFFNHRGSRSSKDNYDSFIHYAQMMDPSVTSNSVFAEQIWDICNVEQLLRIWSVRHSTDDWDTWGGNRGKNCYHYRPDLDGRWHLYAWDMELTYGNTSAFIIPTSPTSDFNPGGFAEVHRMFDIPKIKRMYYAILDEMVNGPDAWFGSSFLETYMNKLAPLGVTRLEIGSPGGFIDQRADLIRPRIASVVFPQVRLTITTNGGNNFTTDQLQVDLAGTAPVEACLISIGGVTYEPVFSSMTTWTIRNIPVIPGTNNLTLIGLDLDGDLIDSDSITVTSTAGPADPPAITSLDPNSASVGDSIDVVGSDFQVNPKVFFDAVEATDVSYDPGGPNPDRITVEVPAGAGVVSVTVENIDAQVSNAVSFTYVVPPPQFMRGDGNGDSFLDISDALTGLLFLFNNQPTDCEDALDTNDDESINLTDVLVLLNYLFELGPAPSAPFPGTGPDPSGTALDCTR